MAKVHVKLTTIKAQLQAHMHYPTEHIFIDDDFLTLDEAFEELLSGFAAHMVRHNKGTYALISQVRKRGWMTEKLADAFADYCITGWKIV